MDTSISTEKNFLNSSLAKPYWKWLPVPCNSDPRANKQNEVCNYNYINKFRYKCCFLYSYKSFRDSDTTAEVMGMM